MDTAMKILAVSCTENSGKAGVLGFNELFIAFPDSCLPEVSNFKKLVSPFALFQSCHTY